MDLWVRVTILPIWHKPISNMKEARKRGELRSEMLKLAEEFEKKIKEVVEERHDRVSLV